MNLKLMFDIDFMTKLLQITSSKEKDREKYLVDSIFIVFQAILYMEY